MNSKDERIERIRTYLHQLKLSIYDADLNSIESELISLQEQIITVIHERDVATLAIKLYAGLECKYCPKNGKGNCCCYDEAIAMAEEEVKNIENSTSEKI